MKAGLNLGKTLCVSIIAGLFLGGCHSSERLKVSSSISVPLAKNINEKKTASDTGVIKNKISHLSQCNRDLESLRTVDISQYRRYQSEYDNLLKSSADFLNVKDDVSPEVAALARPRFQFALVNLCYQIKDALAQTFIKQAGG